MCTLVLAGGWGSGVLGPAHGSIVDLLLALLLTGLVWRLAERHHQELRERTARKLVSFPGSRSLEQPGARSAGTSAVLSFTEAGPQRRDSAPTTAARAEAEG